MFRCVMSLISFFVSSGPFMDQSQVYSQTLYLLVLHKPIFAKMIYKQVENMMIILMSQVMIQLTMNQQKKRSLNQATNLNNIVLKNRYLRIAM